MKILIPVKRVADYQSPIRISADGTKVETSQIKMIMNPFDEIAVEEALRLKEKNIASELIAVSIGLDGCQETLRTALAMGVDRAIHLHTEVEIQPLATAKLLKVIVLQENIELVMLGKQAIDSDNNQVGQMLAALLDWPQGTFISRLEVQQKEVIVTREIDGGLQTIRLSLPAIVTTDLRLNEPRYISLPNIVQAKRKPLVKIEAETLGVALDPHLTTLAVAYPEKRRAGKRVNTVEELIDCLKNEKQVL